jgi:DNA-binding transcriptional regulator LsrR (DeoR family)
VWDLAERLSEDDIHKIALSYGAGELRRDIAARYEISVSSVGRLLRKRRVERDEVA